MENEKNVPNGNTEDFYQSILASSPLGYCYQKMILNQKNEPIDYVFIEANSAFEKVMGFSLDDLLGKSVKEVIPELLGDDFNWIQFYGDVAINGREKEIEVYSKALNKWLRIKVVSKKSLYFITYVLNITYEKEQYTELSISRDINYNILEAANAATWQWHIEKNEVIFNERWAEILGYTLEELSPYSLETWKQLTHPEDLKFAEAQLEKVFHGELDHYSIEFRMKHKAGHWIWILDRGKVISWSDDGKPLQMFGTHFDISEIKEAEEALYEAEWKFKALFEKGPIGVAYHRMEYDEMGNPKDYYFIDANNAYQQLTGVNPIGKRVTEAFPGIELDPFNWIGTFGNVAKMGQEIRFESYLEANDQWYDCVAYQYKPDHFVAAFLNVTSRKKAEKALEKSEANHKAMIAGISDVIAIMDREGIVVYKSPNIEKWFGWKPEEIIGKSGFETAHPEDIGWLTKIYDALLEQEHKSVTVEYRYRCKDGSYKMVELTATNHMGNEYIKGVLVNYRDITERQLADQAIAEEKERLAVTLRSIGDGVIATDIEGNVVMINRVAEDLTGWTQGEAIGLPITTVFNIIHENTREAFDNPVKKVLNSGEVIEFDNQVVLVGKNGAERLISDSGAPIKDKDSNSIGVILVFRDMTEKQKLLANMQRIDKLDSLGILAGGIAHDFNNLLGGIFGYIEMAKSLCEEQAPAVKYLDKALTVFDRAKDLTLQLLTFSKGGEPKRRTGDLGQLVKGTTKFVYSGTNIHYEFDISKDLWLADFDENQMGQVIDNLLINAMQAMPEGGNVVIKANNKYFEDGNNLNAKFVELSICDTGIGIEKDVIKHIFDPFFSTKTKGNGLGLATAYSIIQKHKGRIEVSSQVGKGSVFSIYLPASTNQSISHQPLFSGNHQGEGLILIMDDETFMLEIVSRMLKTMGYQVIETTTGEEVIKICGHKERLPIQAAIFDLTIPGHLGGKEVFPEFHRIYPEVPVFASSGFSEDPTIANPKQYGFSDSIRKPYREKELAELLEKHLGSRLSGIH